MEAEIFWRCTIISMQGDSKIQMMAGSEISANALKMRSDKLSKLMIEKHNNQTNLSFGGSDY